MGLGDMGFTGHANCICEIKQKYMRNNTQRQTDFWNVPSSNYNRRLMRNKIKSINGRDVAIVRQGCADPNLNREQQRSQDIRKHNKFLLCAPLSQRYYGPHLPYSITHIYIITHIVLMFVNNSLSVEEFSNKFTFSVVKPKTILHIRIPAKQYGENIK